MADISLVRHLEIFDPKDAPSVTIIGAGATGSRVFASLVELGCTHITVCDFDFVEAHNLANQIYTRADIGSTKVLACADWYERKVGRPAPIEMRFCSQRIPDDQIEMSQVVFLLTDTMSSRREIFDACLKDNYKVTHVIETRMASSYGNVLIFDPCHGGQSTRWLNTLIDDNDAEVSACGSAISVGPTAAIIANLAVWRFIQACNGKGPAFRTNLFLDPEYIIAEAA